ncbi:peptide ABC transporter ATP-binding protein [Alphaproteobacteria bacterium 46_93_T64]|nr:peptide ABC transporter ATP-binding protein [Alphaproteobacteria bacterium 46_93_T64]
MEPLLSVKDLIVEFKTRAGIARVLNKVSLDVHAGEILGIVGESGCGKSMTALSIMGLIPSPPGKIAGGEIELNGENILTASNKRIQQMRGKEISMIFQEPMTSLNPVFCVGDQIAEAILLHEKATKAEAWERSIKMLDRVGIPEATIRARAYPHELSGGMRQRVMIAMALACNPKVLIADEPTTALDVTVQAQIFDLIKELQQETGTAIIMITHDMGAIAELADRVAVMYAGHVIETGNTEDILTNPYHPYTRGLIACVPHLEENPSDERPYLAEIPGVVPSLTELGKGCTFAPRCSYQSENCVTNRPDLSQITDRHSVSCFNMKMVTAS